MKVQEKINMHKQLNRFENVVDEMKGLVIEKRNESNSIKDDDGEEDKEYNNDGKGDEENYDSVDEMAAECYDLGFLHSKLIKNVFCCLTETQHIGIDCFIRRDKECSLSPGVFFLTSFILELSLLSSDVSIYILLYNTNFLYSATLLFLLKVSWRFFCDFLIKIVNDRSICLWRF